MSINQDLCNVAKHDLQYDEFINWVKKISTNLKKKEII